MAGEKKETGGLEMTLQLIEVGTLLLVARPCRLLAYLRDFILLQLGLLGAVLKGHFSAEGEV